jgi:dTDP-4-dehydrorhamnose 3,5-epimerase
MIFQETPLLGAYVIEAQRIADERGYFASFYCGSDFRERKINFSIVQGAMSFNRQKGTLRGMHFQKSPEAEAKLVRCTSGAVYDVIVDLRSDSATYCRWFAAELTPDNLKALYVPEGFAHGFQALTADTVVAYELSRGYSAQHAAGVRWDDPRFGIKWPLPVTCISPRDKSFPDYLK